MHRHSAAQVSASRRRHRLLMAALVTGLALLAGGPAAAQPSRPVGSGEATGHRLLAGPQGLDPYPLQLPRGVLIAHALGAIDGVSYSNSPEAFAASYERGARYFELDLSFTADGELVCFHRGLEHRIGLEQPVSTVSTAEFLAHRFEGRYSLMTLRTFFEIMAAHPDVYLITDTKDHLSSSLVAVVETAAEVDATLVARIIPQIYQPDDWSTVVMAEQSYGRFASVIFTLYQHRFTDLEVVEAVSELAIPIITMSTSRFNPELVSQLRELGAPALVHTVNDPVKINQYLAQGVHGIYTDRPALPRPPRRLHGRRSPLSQAYPDAGSSAWIACRVARAGAAMPI